MKLGKTQVVVGNNGNEMSNKRAARAKLLFYYSKPIDFCRSRRRRHRRCLSSLIGTLRSKDVDGSENIPEKVNSWSFNLHRDYSKSLTLSNVGEPS